mmetsp:Transcript_39057/g.54985  ORF Transcript_39057/g.54985 Transcript_39057/m.54985 type:complete len:124 (-) Transcript_39057:152-523(-)
MTRIPCMLPSDIVKVPVLHQCPSNMSKRRWDWMQSLPFGIIIFGNSNLGNMPVPTCIAESDLDGDMFCVCWDVEIVTNLKTPPLHIPPGDGDNEKSNILNVVPAMDSYQKLKKWLPTYPTSWR